MTTAEVVLEPRRTSFLSLREEEEGERNDHESQKEVVVEVVLGVGSESTRS